MPMPENNSAWPPTGWGAAYAAYDENDAWWSGDTVRLAKLYGGGAHVTQGQKDSRTAATLKAIAERGRTLFWGAKGRSIQSDAPAPIRQHLPAAANLATLSSDIQFAQSPRFLIDGEDADSKQPEAILLNQLMNSDTSLAQLGTYGETKAALGAAVCVPMFDAEIAPGEVWWESFGPDTAIPTFRNGRLSEVTLWSELQEDRVYWRLLMHHGVENGAGYIEYALFEGRSDNLGRRVDLGAHPLGRPYLDVPDLDEHSRVATGLDYLDAVYGINTPTIAWRKDPMLRYAGRSDFAQLHPLFDDLDRIWSSLMRDIRLGVGRTFMPQQYLTSLGRGQGAAFNELAEYVTSLEMPGDVSDGGKLPIHHQQHAIRIEEHERAANLAYREILRKAGYSQSSWGDGNGDGGGQITATEIEDRNAASERTRAKKNMHDKGTLSRLARIVMDTHRVQFGGDGIGDKLPVVEFPEMSQESPRELAETVQLLDAAGAISLLQRVRRTNPGWTQTQVTEEVNAIRAEQGLAEPDPAALGRVIGDLEQQDENEGDEE
ncbi:hypothetical protein [Pseudomonas sp.]|uniref:hypothetical protein n=1 Tax=Pseudomonas sp. TaxID=306 RepID=UPI00261B8FB0|nr:hypothetical protein [Pseudomonas sp.]